MMLTLKIFGIVMMLFAWIAGSVWLVEQWIKSRGKWPFLWLLSGVSLFAFLVALVISALIADTNPAMR